MHGHALEVITIPIELKLDIIKEYINFTTIYKRLNIVANN